LTFFHKLVQLCSTVSSFITSMVIRIYTLSPFFWCWERST